MVRIHRAGFCRRRYSPGCFESSRPDQAPRIWRVLVSPCSVQDRIVGAFFRQWLMRIRKWIDLESLFHLCALCFRQ